MPHRMVPPLPLGKLNVDDTRAPPFYPSTSGRQLRRGGLRSIRLAQYNCTPGADGDRSHRSGKWEEAEDLLVRCRVHGRSLSWDPCKSIVRFLRVMLAMELANRVGGDGSTPRGKDIVDDLSKELLRLQSRLRSAESRLVILERLLQCVGLEAVLGPSAEPSSVHLRGGLISDLEAVLKSSNLQLSQHAQRTQHPQLGPEGRHIDAENNDVASSRGCSSVQHFPTMSPPTENNGATEGTGSEMYDAQVSATPVTEVGGLECGVVSDRNCSTGGIVDSRGTRLIRGCEHHLRVPSLGAGNRPASAPIRRKVVSVNEAGWGGESKMQVRRQKEASKEKRRTAAPPVPRESPSTGPEVPSELDLEATLVLEFVRRLRSEVKQAHNRCQAHKEAVVGSGSLMSTSSRNESAQQTMQDVNNPLIMPSTAPSLLPIFSDLTPTRPGVDPTPPLKTHYSGTLARQKRLIAESRSSRLGNKVECDRKNGADLDNRVVLGDDLPASSSGLPLHALVEHPSLQTEYSNLPSERFSNGKEAVAKPSSTKALSRSPSQKPALVGESNQTRTPLSPASTIPDPTPSVNASTVVPSHTSRSTAITSTEASLEVPSSSGRGIVATEKKSTKEVCDTVSGRPKSCSPRRPPSMARRRTVKEEAERAEVPIVVGTASQADSPARRSSSRNTNETLNTGASGSSVKADINDSRSETNHHLDNLVHCLVDMLHTQVLQSTLYLYMRKLCRPVVSQTPHPPGQRESVRTNVRSGNVECHFEDNAFPAVLMNAAHVERFCAALGGDQAPQLKASFEQYRSHYFSTYPRVVRERAQSFQSYVSAALSIGPAARDRQEGSDPLLALPLPEPLYSLMHELLLGDVRRDAEGMGKSPGRKDVFRDSSESVRQVARGRDLTGGVQAESNPSSTLAGEAITSQEEAEVVRGDAFLQTLNEYSSNLSRKEAKQTPTNQDKDQRGGHDSAVWKTADGRSYVVPSLDRLSRSFHVPMKPLHLAGRHLETDSVPDFLSAGSARLSSFPTPHTTQGKTRIPRLRSPDLFAKLFDKWKRVQCPHGIRILIAGANATAPDDVNLFRSFVAVETDMLTDLFETFVSIAGDSALQRLAELRECYPTLPMRSTKVVGHLMNSHFP